MDDFERDWRNVIDQLDARRREYRDALDGDAIAKRAAARCYWQAVALVCHCYNQPGNWAGAAGDVRDAPAPRFAFPPTLAKVLGNQAQYLGVGDLPAILTDVAGKGRTAPGPHELRDMAVAVAFVASVRSGESSGIAAPVKCTADAYGVSIRTLQKWCKEMTWVSKDDFGPPDALRSQFEASARNYREAGRSASAGVARAKKRVRY